MPELTDLRPLLSSNVAQDVANYAGELQYQGNVEDSTGGFIAFAGPTADFILYGVVNGAFAQGPPNADANIEPAVNPLPYWYGPVQVSGGAVTAKWVTDASSPSGHNLRFTINPGAASDEAYVQQILPVGGNRNRSLGNVMRLSRTVVSLTSGTAQVIASVRYLDVDGNEIGTAQTTTSNVTTPGDGTVYAMGHTTIQGGGTSPPGDAYYLRIRIGVKRDSLPTDGSAVIDIADVRMDRAIPFLLVGEYTGFGSTYAPGLIVQDGGEMLFYPANGTTGMSISGTNFTVDFGVDTELGGGLLVEGSTTLVGSTTLGGTVVHSGIIYPTISGAVNNYSPTGIEAASTVAITVSGGPHNISGFDAADWTEGEIKTFAVASGDVVLLNSSGSSDSGNRISVIGSPRTVAAGGGFTIQYLPSLNSVLPFRVIGVQD